MIRERPAAEPANPARLSGAAPLVVAASFTADPLVRPLTCLFNLLGLDVETQIAAAGPLEPKLLDPLSDLRRSKGRRVVAFRWSDVGGAERAAALVAALASAGREAATLVLICPGPPGRTGADDIADAKAVASVAAAFAGSATIEVVDVADAFGLYDAASPFDPRGDELAQIPYTDEGWAAMAALVARWRSRAARSPTKLICVDGDETLWGGVLGEAGVRGVSLGDGHEALQGALAAAVASGVALALVTKNDPADIDALFAARSDFPLRRSHFRQIRAGWGRKSDAVREIAASLATGAESVLFIDDNPLECAEVRAGAPGVVVVRAADIAARPGFARHLWPLDLGVETEADRLRAASLDAESQRAEARSQAASLADFHASLDLRIDIREATPSDAARLEQMAARTNQFNSTLERRGALAFADDIARDDRFALAVSVSDRFGDYGLVGGVVGGFERRDDQPSLVVDLWTLSCRALGRGVEHAIAAYIGEAALARGARRVLIRFVDGPRNQPFRSFLDGLAGRADVDAGLVELAAHLLAQTRFDPVAGAAVEDAGGGRTPDPPGAEAMAQTGPKDPGAIFERLAGELASGRAIAVAALGARRSRPAIETAYVAPRSGAEADLARIFADVLNINRVGVEDSFADLGGKSLDAVRIHARLSPDLAGTIALADLFRFSTIRRLAAHAESAFGRSSHEPAASRGVRMRAARVAAPDRAGRRAALESDTP